MAELKREVIKMVRDYLKKNYKSRDCCYICGKTDTLELHHLYSVSELFNVWLDKNNIRINNTVEQMLELRVIFAADNAASLSNDNLYSLCEHHHRRLHNLYGQRYSNAMVPKVRTWIEIQKSKFTNTTEEQ